MNEKTPKKSYLTFILSILLAMTLGVSFLFIRDLQHLNNAYADITMIENISSTTQRFINLVHMKQHSQRDIFVIGDDTTKALKLNQQNTLSVLDNPAMLTLANEVIESWEKIESILDVEDGKDPNYSNLSLARDAHFKAMTDLSSSISEYTKTLNINISQYQAIVISLVFVIAIIILNNLLRTHSELKISQELAKTAQIDVATGLYNRSRCQELFKNNIANKDKKQPAILVLDLNDLKKTNDTLGHRVGDELIFTFAKILKDACDVHTISPFIGRYGGDEFIVFYDDISDPYEIEIYLKELNFLTEQFNSKEPRFQVSYAVGYSYVSQESTEKLTTRQLFDKADASMYENKLASKRANNPNYDEQKEKGEVR